MAVTSADQHAESTGTRTVLVAITVNFAVAVAKMTVGVLSRSSSIIAEGWHAVADTGNEAVLLVAQRRSVRPPDERHPLGHGREAYFWALIAAVGVFVAGGLLSLQEGLQELLHPTPASRFVAAYAVLVIALVLESVSLSQAWRQLHSESSRRHRGLLEHVRLSSEPTTRAVFAEDVAAVVGNLIALFGVALHQVTGSAVPDAIASLLIGVLLGVVGIALAERNRDFLIGEAVPSQMRSAVEGVIAAQPEIAEVYDVLMTFSGPGHAAVIAHVGLDPALDGSAVPRVLGHTADAVRTAVPMIDRAEIVPSDRAAEASAVS